MIHVLTDPTFQNLKTIQHGFFTRHGGVSQGLYASLNCTSKSKDERDAVRENKRRAMQMWGYHLENLAMLENVHGNEVIVVEKPWGEDEKIKADAMVTREKNIILGSTSADCPTVLFADEKAQVVGIAHSGWRGAKSGVSEATVKQMCLLGARRENIVASISACILQESYEVSLSFYEDFLADIELNHVYFKSAKKTDHFLFDLLGFVIGRLNQLQLKNVSALGIDTYTDEENFFSCRRAFHRGEGDFGGHLSCICL